MSSSETTQPINKALLDACIHCGLCLPACPTYLATGREMESPRGRIYLLTQWNSGEQELTPRLSEHIETCLGCLGCVTACPSGVQYGSILNAARPHIAAQRPAGERAIMRFAFRKILPNYDLLQIGGWFLRWWQMLRMGALLKFLATPTAEYEQAAREGKLINPARKLLLRLHEWEALTPKVPQHKPLPRASNKAADAQPTVQLFSGCVMDVFYNHVNHACLRLLEAQGNNVQVPPQTCCGALAMHAGETDIARNLARQNIALLEQSDGPIAVTAAGCGAMLKEYPELFNDDPQWHERAEKVAKRFVDITEALAGGSFKAGVNEKFKQATNACSEPLGVAYHAACHLAHAQNVREAPQSLLQNAVQDVGPDTMHLIPLREAEHCCGSAGIYNLLNTELSMKVLERKMEFIQQTGASVVVTTNPGCMLQLEAGARERGLDVTVRHLCELLDAIYSA
ncbi:MAG TPA: heterodisulfide reductase-related iron-sulfur binding cluster, partial [Trichormus sp.]